MMNGDDKWRLAEDPASVQVLRDILAAAESAYDPDGSWDVAWADVVDRGPVTTVAMPWASYPIRWRRVSSA